MSRPILLYRATCRRCRWLSWAAVAASFGRLRRVPLDSESARELYERHPATRGKLALVAGEHFWCGIAVVPAAARLIVRSWLRGRCARA